jgi:hypothetical protein
MRLIQENVSEDLKRTAKVLIRMRPGHHHSINTRDDATFIVMLFDESGLQDTIIKKDIFDAETVCAEWIE